MGGDDLHHLSQLMDLVADRWTDEKADSVHSKGAIRAS